MAGAAPSIDSIVPEVDDATQRTAREPHTSIYVTGVNNLGAGGVA